jgi:hypothetical protein
MSPSHRSLELEFLVSGDVHFPRHDPLSTLLSPVILRSLQCAHLHKELQLRRLSDVQQDRRLCIANLHSPARAGAGAI